jgi:hypothetical protein
MIAYHCDRDGCGTWIRDGADIPHNFVTIWSVDGGETIAHCCSLDCLMHWAAAHSSAPSEPL